MRWFRMYGEMLDDPKVQMLSPELFKTWVNLLAVASRSGGLLPPVDKLAFSLRVSTHEMQSRIEDLILVGLLDVRVDGRCEPHNWGERQFTSDTSVERTRKYRERIKKKTCDVTVTPDVTPPESDTDTDTDSYGHLSFPEAARSREVDDQKVLKKFGRRRNDERQEKIVRRAEGLGVPVDDLIAAVNRHKARKRSAYFTKLCVDWFETRLPGLDEQVIRNALWGTDEQYAVMVNLLLEAA